MRQLSLFPAQPTSFGGALDRGRRKSRRPLARAKPIHLVLKARKQFKQDGPLVVRESKRLAGKAQVKILDWALGPDHLHLAIRISHRRNYVAFVRALTGILARRLGKGIWEATPFTRVANWGRAYRELEKYLEKNRLELQRILPYVPRRDWYRKRRTLK